MKQMISIALAVSSLLLAGTAKMNSTTAESKKELIVIAEAPLAASGTSSSSKGVVAKKQLPTFSSIESDIVANLTFTQSGESSIEATGPEEIVRLIKAEVRDGVLYISTSKEYKIKKNNVNIKVFSPNLKSVHLDGVGNMKFPGTLNTPMMEIRNDGVGNITFENLVCDELQVISEGVGNIDICGTAKEATYKSDGVGSIDAYEMEAQKVIARLSGVGSIHCFATQRIEANSYGVGSIIYKGNPSVERVSSDGIGKIRRR